MLFARIYVNVLGTQKHYLYRNTLPHTETHI